MSAQRPISFQRPGILALLILAVAGCKTANDAERPEMSTVLGIKGDARYTEDHGETWHSIKKGDLIPSRAEIQTASGMANAVALAIGGNRSCPDKLILYDSSVLKLEKVTAKTVEGKEIRDTKLVLSFGCALGTAEIAWPTDGNLFAQSQSKAKMESIKMQPNQSHYEIRTSNAVVHAEQAIYFASANGMARVARGSVTLEFTDTGNTKEIFAGQVYSPDSGEVRPMELGLPSEFGPPNWDWMNPSTKKADQFQPPQRPF